MPVTPAKAIKDLTIVIEKQNKDIKQKEAIDKLGSDIQALEAANSENSKELRDLFGKVLGVLSNDESSAKARSLAEAQLVALQNSASTEEENREKMDAAEDQANWLEKIASGVDDLANSFDKFADGAKKGLGLFGALAALFLLLTDPEKLFTAVKWAIEKVFGIIEMIEAFFKGDMETAMIGFKENWDAIAIALGVALLFIGGPIIRAIGSVIRYIKGIGIGIGNFVTRIKGIFTAVEAGGGVVKTASTSVGKMFKVFGKIFSRIFFPLFIITTAIQAITGIFDGYKEGGIIGAIKGGLVSLFDALIGWPLNTLKDVVSWILDKLGFKNASAALDSFDFTTMFSDMVDWVGSLMGVAFDWIKDKFMMAVEWIKNVFADPMAALQAAWNALVGDGGLIDIIYKPIDAAIAWIQGLFGWGNPDEPFKLSDVVKNAFNAAKDWVISLFDWARDNPATSWIMEKVDSIVQKVQDFFSAIFDFLPSLDDVMAGFNKLIPDWLKSDDSPEATKYKNMAVTADTSDEDLRKMSVAQDTLATSEEGVFRRLSKERDLARSSGLVTTQVSPDSGVLSGTVNMANLQASAGVGNYASAAPVIVPMSSGGGGGGKSNTNNVQTSTYNISQGMSADDMIRADWVMPIAP